MVSRQECDEVFRKIGYKELVYNFPEEINTIEKLEKKCIENDQCSVNEDMGKLERCHTAICDKNDPDEVCMDKKLDYLSRAHATDVKIYKNFLKCSPAEHEKYKTGRQFRKYVKEELRLAGYNPDSLKDRFQNFKEYLFNISNCLYVVKQIENRYETVAIYNNSKKKSDLIKELENKKKLIKKYNDEYNKLKNTVTKLEKISNNKQTLRQFKNLSKKTKKRHSLKRKLTNLEIKKKSLLEDLENYEYNIYSKNRYETLVNLGKYLKLKRRDIPCKLLDFLKSKDDIFIGNIHENSYVYIPFKLFLDKEVMIPKKYRLEHNKVIERSMLTNNLVKPSSSNRRSRRSSGTQTRPSRSRRQSSQSAGNSIKNKRHTRKVKRRY